MSEAARIRESIDLAEFERRLRGAPADEPQAAYGYAADYGAPTAARPAYPRAADPEAYAAPATNPVASLREQLEAAAARPDSFQGVINEYPGAADRFGSAPAHEAAAPYGAAAAQEPGWRPEAFEPIDETNAGSSRKRALLLGGAAAVLVVGAGLTFALRDGPGSGAAPTIRASGEPYKIQPEAKPAGQKPSEAATILDRNGSERIAASRVVTREEQPVDVREAARQASAANSASRPGPSAGAAPAGLPTAGPAANGFFPEPRRVRTVSVRPDGTIIGEAPQAAPQAPAAPAARQAPTPAARPAAPGPQTTAPAPSAAPVRVAAASPKTSERAAPTTTASTNPAEAPPSPRAAASQSPTMAATPRASGAYAVQLAAPGSESEARAAIANLQRRYGATLGGFKPTVRKASVGSREVYRVRVVGLSQSDASGLCEKLKSAGGSCFVARE